MKAIVQSVNKETLMRFDHMLERNDPTLMVVVEVNFEYDDGRAHSTQKYAFRPDDLDINFAQRQADAMQGDLNHAESVRITAAKQKEEHAAVDAAVDKMRKLHKLNLGDSVKLEDIRRTTK